jgi:ubiquitin C-terminal hydrolase
LHSALLSMRISFIFRFCAKCKKDRTATKKLSLMRIPALLVVHLKRFEGGRAYRTKLSNHISFPIKVHHFVALMNLFHI